MMMLLQLVFCVLLSAELSAVSAKPSEDWPTGKKCPKAKGRVASCVCDPGNNGTLLDLAPLASPTGLPRFTNLTDPNGFSYNYNPCNGFYQGGINPFECRDVHICQTPLKDPENTTDIAADGTEEMFIEDDGMPYVFYRGPDRKKKTKVILNCDQEVTKPVVIAVGDDFQPNYYIFELISCQACLGGCKRKLS